MLLIYVKGKKELSEDHEVPVLPAVTFQEENKVHYTVYINLPN